MGFEYFWCLFHVHKVHIWKAFFSHELIWHPLLSGLFFENFQCKDHIQKASFLYELIKCAFSGCLFVKELSSQSPHLKGFFLSWTDSMGILRVVLLKSYSDNAYILKAPFPHELIQCGFSSCHFVENFCRKVHNFRKDYATLCEQFEAWAGDNTWCSYRAIKMAICMGW